ncbi:Transglycosylase SLT domain-containing protein [Parafrankia irregularis]|uniref:Transglycosylase SLT domain-containing protein n=1 Tax=Parafrankia irregularis TaxID=795642 RepID=A0A0S4QT36_9ACTN|nr:MULTISPECIES: peptidoglycan-binding protein [Parafrankia]MBE3199856.1 peptidoglycan-binding protein [Parafrankia sp. CH37]CUU58008.1 Transglycosylase SLT domain-containing protein [Parafrankia irregularis]
MSTGKHRKSPSVRRRGRGRSAAVAAASVIGASAGLFLTASPASAAVISDTSIAQAAKNAGLNSCRGIPLSTWVAVALAESGGNTTAHATVGEDSRGLWQINMRAHASWVGNRDLYDPNVNAWAARQVCQSQGITAWSAYTNGMHTKYLARGAAAAAAVGNSVSTTVSTAPSASANRAVDSGYMRLGVSGPRWDVSLVQDQLRKLGYPIVVDGYFGPQTNHMVIDFQKKHGLVPDGVIGPLTHKALFG